MGLDHRGNAPPSADAAESLTQRFAAEVWAECGVTAEPVLREGDLKPELRKLLDEDHLDQAGGAGRRAPAGRAWAAGGVSWRRARGSAVAPVPVLVVPGALTKDEMRALALPVGAALDPAAPPAA